MLSGFVARHLPHRRLTIAFDRHAPAFAIGQRIRPHLAARMRPRIFGANAAKLAPQFFCRPFLVVRAPGMLGAFASALLLR
ncbi:MAG: hypothetical protein WBQ55_29065, partial [Xanthobacteraceae bacterium]